MDESKSGATRYWVVIVKSIDEAPYFEILVRIGPYLDAVAAEERRVEYAGSVVDDAWATVEEEDTLGNRRISDSSMESIGEQIRSAARARSPEAT